MSLFALLVVAALFVFTAGVRAVAGDLSVSEVRGLLRRVTERRVLAAIRKLPPNLRDDIGSEWLAEIESVFEKHGPIYSLRWAHGLERHAAPRFATTR